MAISKQADPDTLIWLGVGHTANLGCISDETKAVLVDANPSALKTLERQNPIKGAMQSNLNFELVCLAPQAGEAEFYHYNFSEFSALSKATGLCQLFPGLKLKRTETLNTIAVTDFIRSQSLSTRNNSLRIDIIDQCLPLLIAMEEGGLLSLFKNIELKTSKESLYHHAATTTDIEDFLSLRGYELQTQDNSDPDLPVLYFTLNPLWQTLQNTKLQLLEEKKIAKENQAEYSKMLTEKDAKLEEQARALADKKAKLEELTKAVADKDAKLEGLFKALADKNAKLEEHAEALTEKETKLFEVNKQRDEQKSAKEKQTAALTEIRSLYKNLEAKNRQLQAQIKDNGEELEQLNAELLKAEAQITLIRDLFFKNSTFQVPEGQ